MFEGPQRTSRHMTGCLFMSLISPPAPLCLAPPRGRPIPSSSTEPTSSRTLPHKSSGSAREVSGAFARTTADADALCRVVTQAIVSCVCVRVGARFEVQWCYFYFQSRAGSVISYKRQKNQIKSNHLQCQLVFAPSYSIHSFASFTNLLSIFWTKHVLGIIQMKDA